MDDEARVISLLKTWSGCNLDRRFATIALALVVASTLAIGGWVVGWLEKTILLRSSSIASVYISDLVSPMIQDLATTGQLSEQRVKQLDALLVTGALRIQVVAIKIWSTDGTVVYSSDRSVIGRRYAQDEIFADALRGKVGAELNEPSEESLAEFQVHGPVFEVYAPVYDHRTGTVIAVAEFYEDASEIERAMAAMRMKTWAFTFFVLICNVLAYFSVVHGGTRTIQAQKEQLTGRINELSEAMSREKALRDRIAESVHKVFDENERFLRSLGSELHDGPAQLIGHALLKLDPEDRSIDCETVLQARAALSQAMQEVRAITAGLLLLDVTGQKIEDCLAAFVRSHEARTGTKVSVDMFGLAEDVPDRVKICVCRFIQEGLANAFRHGGGIDQRVKVEGLTGVIRVTVSDGGPGIRSVAPAGPGPHLGLISLRRRVESVNGTMTIRSSARYGTRLVAIIPLKMEMPDAA
ncbi:sensor histidine kinase [Szabonella alba]|uniref:Histidine kinase/HSP90-like ATPase domain-containing protein n=1 Tax=Szabonella alba TaxID=2804194 RepID=A0A8K0Y1J5_9RHOB|nr:ATP-binding protein [Szabonella alba]MBL4919380.1 hypothetical protein [Szabonella alba]